jgi:hypothetical protein
MFSALARTVLRYLALAGLVRDLERLVLIAAGALFLGNATLVFLLIVTLRALFRFADSVPGLGLGSIGGGSAVGPLAGVVPADQLAFMQQVADASACKIPWSVLAGVAYVESDFGTNLGPSSAGAYGYAQFMPGTWPAYGSGVPWRTSDPVEVSKPPAQRFDSSNFHFALPAMADYLCAMVAEFGVNTSAEQALREALFYYNHARAAPFNPNDSYVNYVLGFALRVGTGQGRTVPGQVGGYAWTIAFGFKQPYGAARFSSDVPIHRGIDLIITGAPNNGRGQTYLAFYPGVVAALTHDPFGGLGIIVWDAKNGLYHRYFHGDAVLVSVGQRVDMTTPLGVVGATGTEGFPHLHYEVARGINGDPVCCLVDPQPFLRGEVPLP